MNHTVLKPSSIDKAYRCADAQRVGREIIHVARDVPDLLRWAVNGAAAIGSDVEHEWEASVFHFQHPTPRAADVLCGAIQRHQSQQNRYIAYSFHFAL